MQNQNFLALVLKNRAAIFPWMIAGSLLGFELFQISSDYAALYSMIGVSSWAFSISFGLCAIDFAGLARLNSQSSKSEEWTFLFGAWVLSALGENFLTFVVVSNSAMQRANSNIMVSRGIISYQTWTIYIPIFISLIAWGIQVLLVSRLESAVDKANQNNKRK